MRTNYSDEYFVNINWSQIHVICPGLKILHCRATLYWDEIVRHIIKHHVTHTCHMVTLNSNDLEFYLMTFTFQLDLDNKNISLT